MYKSKERNCLAITVVDDNPVNQMALKLLIYSLRVSEPSFLNNFMVLFPRGELPSDLIVWLKHNSIPLFSNVIDKRGDPYFSKFLIRDLIRSITEGYDFIFYLDPDHIMFNPIRFSLSEVGNSVHVSSERQPLARRIIEKYAIVCPGRNVTAAHCNNSIILGRLSVLKAIVDKWYNIYHGFRGYIPFRYCEEISFCLAIVNSGAELKYVSSAFQSNFKVARNDCSLFHYGGEYVEAKRIKNALKIPRHTKACLANLLRERISSLESVLIKKMISLLSEEAY